MITRIFLIGPGRINEAAVTLSFDHNLNPKPDKTYIISPYVQKPEIVHNTFLKFGDIHFDLQTFRLFNDQGDEIFLSSTEQLLLKVLSQNPFKPLTREELSTRAGFVVNERTIDVQITRLRKKIKDDVAQPKYIKTIRHIGYALYPENERV